MTTAADVIVPAHNSAATVGATLAAIFRQEVTAGEVIVVDDRSSDATAEIAEAAGARVISTPSQLGAAGARNLGVSSTGSELLAFTDADCEPDANWLRAAIAEIEAGADLVTGPVQPVRPPGPFDRTLDIRGPSLLFETANVIVRRSLFEEVGGFRQPDLALADAGRPFGEDVLFGWECVRAGARVAFAEGALVRHEVFPRGAVGFVREAWRLRLFPSLVAEVPGLAGRLPLGLFLSRKTALFDLAVASGVTAAASRRAAPLALVAPYALFRFRGGRPWNRAVAKRNAAYLAADLLGLAALLYGSARSRRPLL